MRRIGRAFMLALGALLLHAAGARGQESVTLPELFAIAERANPRLQAARALADARGAAQSAEAVPPDPALQLGVMNLSLPRLETDMPDAMLPSVQLMQMVPTAGKLSLAGRIARQGTAIARHDANEVWWSVRLEVAREFYALYAYDRQLAVMRETLRLLEEARVIARAMYAAGEARQTDVLRAGVEIARMDADIARMSTMRQVSAARLNALLDRAAGTPVGVAVVSETLLPPLPADSLRVLAEETRPMLQSGRVALEQARTRRTLMAREIWPDVNVGVQYGQRPGMESTERMGSLMIGFSIPIFARQRQLRLRDEASAMQRMAAADLAAMRAQVEADIAQAVAELGQARTLATLYREEILPQARANATSALTAYRAGGVDFMTLLDARMTVNEFEQELHVLIGTAGTLVAELEMIVGRALAVTAPVTTEAP